MKVFMVDALVGNDYSFCLCHSLGLAGVDVSLIVTEDRSDNKDVPISFSVKKWSPAKDSRYNKTIKTIKYFQYLLRLLVSIIKSKTHVVHFQYFRRTRIESLYFLFLKLIGTKLVYTVHDILPHEKLKIDRCFSSIVFKASTILVAHSAQIKNQLVDHFNINDKKIRIIPHGNFDNYLPKKALSKLEARKDIDLSENDDVLLFFGNIREYKGLDLLLDAFLIAAKRNRRLKLVIAGSPYTKKLEEHYHKLISEHQFRNRVIYHSKFIPTPNVANYFIASDVVVLPYQNIYHSGVLHLAYSFGRPVITTKVGDFPETIEHGKSGYVLGINTDKNLAKTITEIFSDSKKLNDMGKYARHLSETKYSWINIAGKTKAVYQSMAD